MVIKINNIHPLTFRSTDTKPEQKSTYTDNSLKELSAVTPDFGVKTPMNYKKTGEYELTNGLKLHSYKLQNGYRVSIIPMSGSPAVVKNYVNVGSMNETDDIKGISHFLEHMAFNGTIGDNGYLKLETGDSFKKIDKLGGWTNASTSYAVTDYVNSTPLLEDSDLEEQIKILASMTENLALAADMVEKEKGPVTSEINMILDDTMTVAMDQTVRTLYGIKSSADELIAGSCNHIENLTKEKVENYYKKYYTPDNMNLVITGDVDPDEVMQMVSKNFKSQKTTQGSYYYEKMEPITKTKRKDFLSNKTNSTDIVIGFSSHKNNDVKSEIISEILYEYLSTSSAGLVEYAKNMNSSLNFGREKISSNPNAPTMTFVYANCNDSDSEKVLKMLHDKLGNFNGISEDELKTIKNKLLICRKESFEYSGAVNTIVGNKVLDNSTDYLTNYEKILDSLTVDDINNYFKKYFDLDKAAITVVHPDVDKAEIVKNYNEASSLTFKGKHREPLNIEKISTTKLDNNFDVGFYETDTDNLVSYINFETSDLAVSKKGIINPSVYPVLQRMLQDGTKYNNYKDYTKLQEENNIGIMSNVSPDSISFITQTPIENYDKSVELVKELIYNPRFDEESFQKAVAQVKSTLEMSEESAVDLYNKYDSANNPFNYSVDDVKASIDSLKLSDVVNYYNDVMKNSYGKVVINVPKDNPEFKNKVISECSKFETVQPYEYKTYDLYKENDKPVILTEAKDLAQADIIRVNTFKFGDTIDETAAIMLINEILNSSSIGLFDNLREKQNLAYYVRSNYSVTEDRGTISCSIKTTTDDKNSSNEKYDNLEKSIRGFQTQIDKLLNSEFTDEDLENAKRKIKAQLLNNEGTYSKVGNLFDSMNKKDGADYLNLIYSRIDELTRDDINYYAKNMFKDSPVYAIVASQDTLDNNKNFLDSLSN